MNKSQDRERMNLLCPTCQKQLQVGEQYAGQMMQCPLCTAKFTVPVLPQMPAAAPMPAAPPPPPPQQFVTAKPPRSATGSSNDAPPAAPGGAPRGLTISPRLLPWAAPLSLLMIFVLLFFSWVGMYPGGVGVVTQTGWQAASGGVTANDTWKGYATSEEYWKQSYDKKAVQAVLDPGMSVLLIFFILVLLPAVVISFAVTAVSLKLLPLAVPLPLQAVWPLRSLAVAGLAMVLLVLLVLVLWAGFPLEQTANRQVDAAVNAARDITPSTGEKNDAVRWTIEHGVRLGGFALRTTPWLMMALLFNVTAVVGAMLEFFAERKNAAAAAPPP